MADENLQLQQENAEEQLQEQQRIRRERLAKLVAQGKDPFAITRFDRTAYNKDITENFEAYEGKVVTVAGRLMSWRDMGKATFMDIQDPTGKIQLYIKINNLGEEAYAAMSDYDLGDILGVEGEVFRTRRGEISLKVDKLTLLTKSLRPLRRSSMASRMWTPGTASGIWT